MDLHPVFENALFLTTITAILAAFLAKSLLYAYKSGSGKTPPGPSSRALLGKLCISSHRLPLKESVEWSKKYGPIISLKQGSVDIFILNDNELIRKTFSRPEFQDRPTSWGLNSELKGFSTFSGHQWEENREFTMRALAKLGLGSQTMRKYIQFEARHLADTLASYNGQPVASFTLSHRSHMNSMCQFLFGYRYDLDDPRFAPLQEALLCYKLQTAGAPVEHRAAWLRRTLIEPLWPSSISATRRNKISNLYAALRELLEKNEETKNSGRAKTYVDLYMEKIREANSQPGHFTENTLVGNMVDIMTGSSTSGNYYLHFHLLNLASRVDNLQADLQREIDAVVGCDRSPCWEDRTSMPLVMATIWEMFRWKLITPFNIPRTVGNDTNISGYNVKKETAVLPNLMVAHRDEKLWKNPDDFDPSRFLNTDGTAMTAKPIGVLSFSIGRRICPFENMAMVNLFLFLTTLLQQFRILPEDDKPIIIAPFGPSPELRDAKLRFVRRMLKS